jgi:hypothetical protein
MRRCFLLALVPLLLVACDRGGTTDEPPEVSEARRVAAREACIAGALLERSYESVDALLLLQPDDVPAGGAAGAAIEFARAYLQNAELHYVALAYADSAANHARTPADSVRYLQAGQGFVPRRPEIGTVEGNVAAAWLRDFATILADEDHRCHWDI